MWCVVFHVETCVDELDLGGHINPQTSSSPWSRSLHPGRFPSLHLKTLRPPEDVQDIDENAENEMEAWELARRAKQTPVDT